jgi:hypothetical protein
MKWAIRITLLINIATFLYWVSIFNGGIVPIKRAQFSHRSNWQVLQYATIVLSPPGSAIMALLPRAKVKWRAWCALVVNAATFIFWGWIYLLTIFLIKPELLGCCSKWEGLQQAAIVLTPPGSAIVALLLNRRSPASMAPTIIGSI